MNLFKVKSYVECSGRGGGSYAAGIVGLTNTVIIYGEETNLCHKHTVYLGLII